MSPKHTYSECNGSGEIEDDGDFVECDMCDGTGLEDDSDMFLDEGE